MQGNIAYILYVGTGLSRLELKAKGDSKALYTNLTTVIIAAGAVWLPLMHWLMDHRGYGATLIVINTFGVLCSTLQVSGVQTWRNLCTWASNHFESRA